jgi:hypothetical protein
MPIGLTYEIQHQVMAGDTQTRFALISGQSDDVVVETSGTFYRLLGIQLARFIRGGRRVRRFNQ